MNSLVCSVGDLVEDIAVRLMGPMRRASDTDAVIARHRGGSAANVAAMVQRTGGRARFVGRVGDDVVGDNLVGLLEGAGVDVIAQRSGRSGTIIVLVEHDGERSFLTDRAAAGELAGIDPAVALDGVAWLHLPWYSLHRGQIAQTARSLLDVATRRSISVSLDPSSYALLEGPDREAFLALVREYRPAVVLANEDEAATLGIDTAGSGLEGAAVTIVKQGHQPALVLRADEAPSAVPIVATEVVDTTGAGDAFAAGYIVAAMRGAGPIAATRTGHGVAACVVASVGADSWVGQPTIFVDDAP